MSTREVEPAAAARPEPPAESVREGALKEAAGVAKGSGIAMAGALINRGLRLVNTWQLSNALGVYYFGLYTSVTTIVNILAYFGPLGMNSGVVLFGSRYLGSGERDRLKGALLACFGLAALSGTILSGLYIAAALLYPWSAEKAELGALLPYGALSITAWAVLLVAVNALRVARDARAQTSVYNITLPVLLTTLSVAATAAGFGVRGALLAFGVAHLLTFGEAMLRFWRHFGPVLRDRAVVAQLELGPLLRFSIPESLSSMLFRLTQWMDQLLLTAQSTPDQVGIYKVASAMAMLGSVPAAALSSIFNATAAELLYLDKRAQLDHVLKLVTRWIIATASAVTIGIILGQDLVYAMFQPEYAAGATSLVALLIGQLVFTACVPATALIPMSGMARLNLLNGAAATLLNFGLNLVMIPRYGALGSSVATMITLVLWSGWRVWQVKRLLSCFPLTWGSAGVMLVAVLGAWGVREALSAYGLVVHGLAAVLVPLAFLAALWRLGHTPDDDVILRPLTKKLRRVLGMKAKG